MKDSECVEFLQWSLPRLGFRWPGFRKVRRQVCKRIARRICELQLEGLDAYRDYLKRVDAEWDVLDQFCRISISRFYRDRGVFNCLREAVLPAVAKAAQARGESAVRCWSAGCASGEEPYTLNLIWRISLTGQFSDLSFSIIATDADQHMLSRAHDALYPASSLKDLPTDWIPHAFEAAENRSGALYRLRPEFQDGIEWVCQDLRQQMPAGPFHLILCRHLAFTYFDSQLQQQILDQVVRKLTPGGVLVTGKQEQIEADTSRLQLLEPAIGIYQKPN